jgi:hypothetical protein
MVRRDAVTVTGAAVEPRTPVSLFPTRIYGGGVDNQQGWQYDVARDGRFLINSVVDSVTSPITAHPLESRSTEVPRCRATAGRARFSSGGR